MFRLLFLLLPVTALAVSDAPQSIIPSNLDDVIFYGGLKDKGLPGSSISQQKPPFQYPRPRPQVSYPAQGVSPERPGSAEVEAVEITLRREQTSPERTEATFGFPLAKGAVFDLEKIRVIDPESRNEFPLQVNALAFWPDGSVKSAYLQFPVEMAAEKRVKVEFGNRISRTSAPVDALKHTVRESDIQVSTGAIEVIVGTDKFAPLKEVYALKPERRLLARSSGFELLDENGALYSSLLGAPESVRVEREGSYDLVLRIEGKFFNEKSDVLMRYISRLRFVAGSGKVDMSVTLVNDVLDHEFTDTSRFALNLKFPDIKPWKAMVDFGSGPLTFDRKWSFHQWDENTVVTEINDKVVPARGRVGGAIEVGSGDDRVQIIPESFWQRWPKGVEISPGSVNIDFLPPQPEGYGKDFPDHLRFPFVEGRYRMKWGMSFTERLRFDFLPSAEVRPLLAGAGASPRSVIPPEYILATGVFSAFPIEKTPDKDAWDGYVHRTFEVARSRRDILREYGYLNYGDWYGERGRNWGNNEYDRPHGYFVQYLRSGQAEFLDAAIAGVRHQADVDIIHAYPDPLYIGANHQHSIGHTGVSYQRVNPKTWSFAYGEAEWARNGHTWANGMADAWLLTGDPVVMESLLALGEHIRWAFAPAFKNLGTHQRSAGWSLQAALETYRATSDPEYLNAARMIKDVALREIDPASGAYSHKLPPDHAEGKTDVVGNSVYNVGILLTALSRYHEVTKDPELLPYMSGMGSWLVDSWQEEGKAWPYSALPDGSPASHLTPQTAPLNYPGLAYAGLVLERSDFLQLANLALTNTFPPGAVEDRDVGGMTPAHGKMFSVKLFATDWTLAVLEAARKKGLLPASPSEASPTVENTPPKP